jgi:ABC-type sugar transport system, permease component
MTTSMDAQIAQETPAKTKAKPTPTKPLKRDGSPVRSVLMLLLALIAAIPLYYILISSFKTSSDMAQNPLSLPQTWTLDNFTQAFELNNMGSAFLNSLIITIGAIVLQIVISSLASYGMIIGKWWFTATVGVILTIAFAIPLQATLVPQYRMLASVGLTDSLLGVILLYTSSSVFCYFLMVGYMRALPFELIEAARIDGAGPFRIYWKIILPLSRPILITVIVFQTMSTWNDFLIPNVYLASPSLRTVILQVYNAVGQFTTNWPLFMATTVIALVPVFIFFVFCQRWIISGLVAGSVKG